MRKVKFLFVDDLEANLLALEALLQHKEVEIFKASSGKKALDLLLLHEFALAIIDVQMPEMDGFELAELMRGTEKTKTIPIIFVTAGEHDKSRVFQGYEAGAVDFLFKPLDPRIVINKVHVFYELGRQKILLSEHMKKIAVSLIEAETARSALASKNKELEQFANIASHDLKEPLRTISTYLQLLIRKHAALLDDSAKGYIDFSIDAAKRMSTLIDGLLEYARTGENKPRNQKINLNELLEVVLSNLAVSITEKNAKVNFFNLPMISGDQAEMVQLFQNLIGNAIKFQSVSPPQIEIKSSRSEEGWCICVSDNGIGFAEDKALQIFEPFTRLHTRGTYPGSGIGLAVCKKIIEANGGKIWAESKPEHGASFFFTLPAT
jgi:two-component system sensor histidine kinase/response regulator